MTLSSIAVPALLAAQRTQAPDSYSRGRSLLVLVRDTADHPLTGAVVYARTADGRIGPIQAVRTDGGRARIEAPATTTRVIAARIGFSPETLIVTPRDTLLRFQLRRAPVAIAPALVRAEQTLSATSSSVIRQLDLELRPRESSQELLRLVPGLVIAQHAGGGKAEQIFLRGFDADHGTDIAISVDGTPVNMVTHAHGQGYADLHFLMPEVVERVDVRKGPYDARDGNFATAGAVSFVTKDRIPEAIVAARRGSFGTAQGLLLVPFGGDVSRAGGYFAGSSRYTDGPFVAGQRYQRQNAFVKGSLPLANGVMAAASASAFDARWKSSGQIPLRLVSAGKLDRFGAVDNSEGGNTARYEAAIGVRPSVSGPNEWAIRAWASRYRFQLYSNFTFFASDSVNGDGIEQVDDRASVGATAHVRRWSRLVERDVAWEGGMSARVDDGDVALYQQRERQRLGDRVVTSFRESSIGPWARGQVQLSERARLEVGVRGDAFRFEVHDRTQGASGEATVPRDAVTRWAAVISPKASFAYDAGHGTTLFVNAGRGFHSNDARELQTTGDPDGILARALGAELGARRAWSGGAVAMSAWAIDLSSELLWSGDEGTTEASGRTRRIGLDVETRARLFPWLWADADLSLARGRLRDEPAGADRVPLAPPQTLSAGLTALSGGPWTGGARLRHVGSRPANEDASIVARGHTIAETFASYDVGRLRIAAAVDNVLNARWNEAQFATTSRLRFEQGSVTDLHFTPGAPRSFQLSVEYRFR